jgi:hypothetical protein
MVGVLLLGVLFKLLLGAIALKPLVEGVAGGRLAYTNFISFYSISCYQTILEIIWLSFKIAYSKDYPQ